LSSDGTASVLSREQYGSSCNFNSFPAVDGSTILITQSTSSLHPV
jgi:hypothetical protein